MFDATPFRSTRFVLLGALFLAGLFGLVALMAEWVLTGRPRLTADVIRLSGLAFVGFLLVAAIIRRRPNA
ncbi:MAG: hypothetical protein Q9M35_07670 [Rhodothermus sp.]|nr:hypothetical protein [Rhodothermus sp.]